MGLDVAGLLRKASEKSGFRREKSGEARVPTDPANVTVVPVFPSLRGSAILSSLLLNRYRTEDRGSRYFVVASWPGQSALYPYADEFWGIDDAAVLARTFATSGDLGTPAETAAVYYRNLNNFFFEDVVTPERDMARYYSNGLTDVYWRKYREVRRHLPMVPSMAVLGKELVRELNVRQGFKVFLCPTKTLRTWREGKTIHQEVTKHFWEAVVRRLVAAKMTPVLWRSFFSHDLSLEFPNECVHVVDDDLGRVMGAMRATGMVLDVFNELSRLALLARTPFVCLSERNKYFVTKDFELDDLLGVGLPRQYIFSFPTILKGQTDNGLDSSVLSQVVARLEAFVPELRRDEWPGTSESSEVIPYSAVRTKKRKRFGTRLLKVPRGL
jgi:hypothetical protein